MQQPIGAKNVVVLTYSGNHGYNLLLQDGFVNGYAAGFAGLPAAAPDPRFAQVTELSNQETSNYDGLTVQYRRSLGYGFNGQISYTRSPALDDISNDGAGLPYSFCSGCSLSTLANPNIAANYGNADYDIRHNVTGDLFGICPFKFANRNLLSNLLANWTVAGKLFLRSGTPFSVIDSNLAGSLSPNINATMLGIAVVSGLPEVCGSGGVNTPCFTSSQFLASSTETAFGNLGRNAFHGPNYFSMDFSLYKNFNVTERMRLQIGATA